MATGFGARTRRVARQGLLGLDLGSRCSGLETRQHLGVVVLARLVDGGRIPAIAERRRSALAQQPLDDDQAALGGGEMLWYPAARCVCEYTVVAKAQSDARTSGVRPS